MQPAKEFVLTMGRGVRIGCRKARNRLKPIFFIVWLTASSTYIAQQLNGTNLPPQNNNVLFNTTKTEERTKSPVLKRVFLKFTDRWNKIPKTMSDRCGHISFQAWPYGRLGIQMNVLATLYILARSNAKRAYLSTEYQLDTIGGLQKYFETDFRSFFSSTAKLGSLLNMNIKAYHDSFVNKRWFQFHCPKDIHFKGFHQQSKLFTNFRQDVSSIFRFKAEIYEDSLQYLEEMLTDIGKLREECVLVGVHSRRGDKVDEYGGGRPASADFITRAMAKFVKQFNSSCLIFVMSGEDKKWNTEIADDFSGSNRNRRHIVIVKHPSKSPAVDMCVLTLCDHMIMTSGTYSFWAAYLNGGNVYYQANADDHIHDETWHGLQPCYQHMTVSQLRTMFECWPNADSRPKHLKRSCVDTKVPTRNCYHENDTVNWSLEYS